ncbi:sentrin-specific protease 1-like [Aphis gossypii]|uniref:sentrin-specific protease 1-like n=1 Tax=Aphis gossypii TaxID=80765 RepID=UPI002158B9DC|nr:sentrin-specific protease 1-like [Aphis gossypii]
MAPSTRSTNCPEQLTTMSDLSNPNGNARPQRKCTRSKRIYEGYEMTKITKRTTTKKRSSRQFKKPLLHVDTASSESERPSNVCVTQPNVTQPNVTQPNVTQPNVTQPNVTQPNVTQPNVTQPNVTQPNIIQPYIIKRNNGEVYVIVSNSDNNANNYPSDRRIAESLFVNIFNHINTVDYNNKIFPGYDLSLITEFKRDLVRKNVNAFLNKKLGLCSVKDLYQVFLTDIWLNDLIVQHYFNLLGSKSNNTIYVLSTYFFLDLKRHGIDGFTERYLKNVRLLNYSKVLVPTHLGNHWVLIVVDFSEKKIIYYDSLDYFASLCPKILMLKQYINLGHIAKEPNYQYGSNITDVCSGISPKQTNVNDCGIFTCTNARYNMCNKSSTFNQEDIPLLRQKLFYEMFYNELLPIE